MTTLTLQQLRDRRAKRHNIGKCKLTLSECQKCFDITQDAIAELMEKDIDFKLYWEQFGP